MYSDASPSWCRRASARPSFSIAASRYARRGLATVTAGLLLTGCGYTHINRDSANRPERSTGSAARVVLPGEQMPAMDEPITTSEPVQLGGSSAESDVSTRDRDVPFGPLTVLLGYPFWIFGKSVSQEADQAVTEREQEEQAQRGSETQRAAKRREIQQERLERENARMREALRRGSADPATSSRTPEPTRPPRPDKDGSALPSSQPSTGARGRSQDRRDLQRELATLQRAIERRSAPAPSAAPRTQSEAVRPEESTAPLPAPLERSGAPLTSRPSRNPVLEGEPSRVEDQDRDGRPDRWLFGSPERPTRELLDQNRDGRADVVRHFDADSKLVRLEEDLDFDGSFEITTQFREGQRSRRLEDTDADGRPDRWTYFQGGEVRRIESDADGDGFRDSVSLYSDGQLEEQQQDRNGDGQPDRLERYRAGETIEVHEDLDGDGALDVASYYEAGKLVRRELRSAEVLQRWSGGEPTPVTERAEAP